MARNGSVVSSGLVVHSLGRRFICSLHCRLEKMSNDILHSFACATACGCTRHPQCKPVSTLRFELCQPMTAALPADKRCLRQIAVLWAARASHRLLTLIIVVLRPKAQGCVNYLVCGEWGLASAVDKWTNSASGFAAFKGNQHSRSHARFPLRVTNGSAVLKLRCPLYL